jgi:hypothetical protein
LGRPGEEMLDLRGRPSGEVRPVDFHERGFDAPGGEPDERDAARTRLGRLVQDRRERGHSIFRCRKTGEILCRRNWPLDCDPRNSS